MFSVRNLTSGLLLLCSEPGVCFVLFSHVPHPCLCEEMPEAHRLGDDLALVLKGLWAEPNEGHQLVTLWL